MLYTLSVMIINDHLLRICYYHVGFPENVHDESVYRNCDLAKNPDLYFDIVQFLVGDSAFTPREGKIQYNIIQTESVVRKLYWIIQR